MAATYPTKLPPAPKPERRSRHLGRRGEPGKWPAAFLAIIIHGAFFALIVFGVSWQVKHPMPVAADLWSQLPPSRNAATPPPTPAPEPEPAPAPTPPPVTPPVEKLPPPPSRADVELKAKREREAQAKKEVEQELLEKKKRDDAKVVEKKKIAEAEKRRREEDAKQKLATEKLRKEQEDKENAARAATNAAIRDYGTKIAALIRNRANIPDTVTGKPVIQVRVRLLVQGVVLDAQVVKPSGNRVYDEAVERAINGIRQWPLPESAELFGGRRELILNIEHER